MQSGHPIDGTPLTNFAIPDHFLASKKMNVAIAGHRPSPGLVPFVQSYWTGRFNLSGEANYAQSVVPNGCIELIIHLSDAHCSLHSGQTCWSKSPAFTLLGLYTQPYEVQFSTEVRVFGIRFFPDGIRQIFGVPPATFLASYEDGVEILGPGFRDFCSRLRETISTEAQIQQAEVYIRSQLHQHQQQYDYTHQAMHLIRKLEGIADYQELTARVPISDRQLQREFKSQYGITVSDYMRLSRMNAIQKYMQGDPGSLTQLSYELQFSDQSHFIREFKHFVGLSPGKFRKNRNKFIVNPALSY